MRFFPSTLSSRLGEQCSILHLLPFNSPLQRLKTQRVCTMERLSELATKLMTAINQVAAE